MASDWTLKAHDRLPSIQAALSVNGQLVNLTTAVSVKFIMRSKDGLTLKVNSAATIVTAGSGVVRYDWATGDTDTAGDYQAEWQVTWPGSKTQTFPTASFHTISILQDLDNA